MLQYEILESRVLHIPLIAVLLFGHMSYAIECTPYLILTEHVIGRQLRYATNLLHAIHEQVALQLTATDGECSLAREPCEQAERNVLDRVGLELVSNISHGTVHHLLQCLLTWHMTVLGLIQMTIDVLQCLDAQFGDHGSNRRRVHLCEQVFLVPGLLLHCQVDSRSSDGGSG